LAVFGVLVVLGFALHRLTSPQPPTGADNAPPATTAFEAPGAGGRDPEQNASLSAQITFSAPAQSAELRHLGKVIWSAKHPPLTQKVTLQLPFPPEGVELAARVEWGAAGPCALRVQLTTPDGSELDRTAWGETQQETILPFP
jgi:hypothetical protein